MRILLDTHTLLWWLLGDKRPSPRILSLLSADGTKILVSAVSGVEIAIKCRLGKLDAPAEVSEQLDQLVARNSWQPLPLTIAQAQLAGRLLGSHKDPFDRMLAAQAISENVKIATNDLKLSELGADVTW